MCPLFSLVPHLPLSIYGSVVWVFPLLFPSMTLCPKGDGYLSLLPSPSPLPLLVPSYLQPISLIHVETFCTLSTGYDRAKWHLEGETQTKRRKDYSIPSPLLSRTLHFNRSPFHDDRFFQFLSSKWHDSARGRNSLSIAFSDSILEKEMELNLSSFLCSFHHLFPLSLSLFTLLDSPTLSSLPSPTFDDYETT